MHLEIWTKVPTFVVPGTVMYISSERSWASLSEKVVGVWDLVDVSLQHPGIWSRTFYLVLQRCCELGRGKAACGRHGSGALCMTKLSCMTIEELTHCRESLHVDSRRCSLWGLWTVSRECHEILQNCPWYKGQKIDDYVQNFHESNNGMCACVRAQTTWYW